MHNRRVVWHYVRCHGRPSGYLVEKEPLRKSWTGPSFVRGAKSGDAFHEGFSLVTRLFSKSGRGIAQHETTFDVIPWEERKVSLALDIDTVSKLTAARFGAEFRGFEDIAIGFPAWSQLRGSRVEESSGEHQEWYGEEVRETFSVGRG